jgi:DNA polymerase-3 subunit epsilon
MGRWYLRQLETEEEPALERVVFAAPKVEGERRQTKKPGKPALVALVIYVNPELEQLRELVAGARARLAELETTHTREKSRVDAIQAALFRRLREQYQKRDRLRLVVDYRKKYLDSLLRGGEEEAKQAEENYEQARTHTDQDYEKTAATVAKKRQLTADEEEELTQLWKKLVKLYHPDRFANQPDKLEIYHKLTSAINRAKDSGDIETLREIAEDPEGFILRNGWEGLDFSEEAELDGLRRLHETLELEIVNVLEALNRLRESPEFELCQLVEKKPGFLEELAGERAKLLDKESNELAAQANRLADEIKDLSGEAPAKIV